METQLEKLKSELAKLKIEIASLVENTKPIAPNVSLGRLTRMDAIASKGVNESILYDARIRQKELERALEQLETGVYGICQSCGKPIAAARLEFIPEAKTCMACA